MEGLELEPRVAVIGVGGAGGEVVNRTYDLLPMADAIAVNCDKEAMQRTRADKKLYICKSVTNGEGAKGDVGLGRDCAKAHIDDIEKAMTGYDAVFIIAGMGGGTGTGATPVIAERARSMGLMTFVIAIDPFSFETARVKAAKEGIARIRQVCANTIVVENDLLLEKMPEATMRVAMDTVNKSIVSFIGKKVDLIKKCFETEFEAISEEIIERKLAEGSAADVTEVSNFRPKTAKE